MLTVCRQWSTAERSRSRYELVWYRCLDFGCDVEFRSRVDGCVSEGTIACSGDCRETTAKSGQFVIFSVRLCVAEFERECLIEVEAALHVLGTGSESKSDQSFS